MTKYEVTPIICVECGHESLHLESCSKCGSAPTVNGYKLVRRIGHGAVGTTYEARRLSDGKRLAIKEILVRRFESAKGMQLFEREAETLQRLEHPGIPKYYEHFIHGHGRSTGFYLVQEFVDGWTLEEEAARRSYTDPEIVEIGKALAEILGYTEGRLVHRDIKPANIMRRESDGALVLIDFGSVRQIAHSLTDGSTITGTVGFMAPEQLWGRATFETDVYGVGMTLLALRAGRLPEQVHSKDGALNSGLQLGELRSMFEQLLAEDPDNRPNSAATLMGALCMRRDESQKSSGAIGALQTSEPELHLTRRRSDTHRFFALLGGIAITAILGSGMIAIFSFGYATPAVGVVFMSVVLFVLFGTVWSHPH